MDMRDNNNNNKTRDTDFTALIVAGMKTILYASMRDIIKQWWRMKPNRKTNYVSLMETFSCKYASKQGDRQRLQSPYQILLIKCNRGWDAAKRNANIIFIWTQGAHTHLFKTLNTFRHILMTCAWCARYWCLNCDEKESNSSKTRTEQKGNQISNGNWPLSSIFKETRIDRPNTSSISTDLFSFERIYLHYYGIIYSIRHILRLFEMQNLPFSSVPFFVSVCCRWLLIYLLTWMSQSKLLTVEW